MNAKPKPTFLGGAEFPKIFDRPKPKLICVDGRIIADAVVIVSEKDPNWYKGPKAVLTDCVVTVRAGRV